MSEMPAEDIKDRISKILDAFPVAKSRRSTNLTPSEKAKLLLELEVLIEQVIKEVTEEAEVRIESTPSHWVGVDKGADIKIEAAKKSEILEAWLEEFGIKREEVLSTKIGEKYFYVFPSQDEDATHELWIYREAA